MCLDDMLLSEYLDNSLEEPWKSQVEGHLKGCPTCQKRLKELSSIKASMKNATLEDKEINLSKDRVLTYLNKNVLNKKGKFRTLIEKIEKFIKIPIRKIMPPILASCVTFCFCLIIFTNSPKESSVPTIPNSIFIDNIVPVRATDNYTTSESIKRYSLDEILKYLDSLGYDVSISLKPIKPLEITSITE